jgi:hypothetical protein
VGALRAPVKYHYFHRLFSYSVKRKASRKTHVFSAKSMVTDQRRSAPKTVTGGEFDWGGTSVK